MHPCRYTRSARSRGTVSLVALCFVAVLGISLASYIAVCSRAMQLSNRSFQASVSQQLAEAGIEEALRAFNQNNWDGWSANPSGISGGTTAWTLDTTNKRATRTITIDSTKLGQGATATVKLRIDNYDANVVGVSWINTKNYRVGEIVERNGVWYRSMRSNSNQTPNGMVNMAYWVPDPIPSFWDASIAYKNQDVAFYTANNTWYRYTNSTSTTGNLPTDTTYWTSISKISIDNGYSSINREILNYFGTWYYYSFGWRSTPNPPNSYSPVISWCWRYPYDYSFNDLVCYGYPAVWYRCKVAHTSSSSILPTNATYWENALSGSMHGWNSSGINYNLGDAVYSSSQWYRCIRAHTSSTSIPPTNTTYWTSTPLYSPNWDAAKQYSQNDSVRYNGVWYLSLQNSNVAQNPETATSYWIGANTTNTSYTWSPSTSYSVNAYRCYGGVWYKCIAATTANAGHTPNNTTYWSAAWSNSWGITTGAPVVYAEATVTLTGNPTQRTQLRAAIAPSPLFPNAAAATSTISANSGGTVDSYDSQAGAYNPSTAGHSAVLAAGGSITLSSTTVKGYLAWPTPPSGIGTSASVKGPSSPASPNVDPTRISRSPYIPQFTTLPGGPDGLATNWSSTHKGTALALATTINIGTPGATTPSRYHYNGTLNIGSGTVTNLRINGPVILYINGDLNITSSGSTGRVDITGSGSAEIHLAGAFKASSGSEGIVNATTDPRSLVIISDTTSTSTHYYSEGLNPLYGVVYIPYSTSNSGYFNDNNNTHVYGAISANKITYSGANMNIHYDTSLRYATIPGVDQPWTATEWRELPVTERATMP